VAPWVDESLVCGGFGLTHGNISVEKGKQGNVSETEAGRQHREAKAARVDDAEVPVHLWNVWAVKGCQWSLRETTLDWTCDDGDTQSVT
jgi:hypothetical protein